MAGCSRVPLRTLAAECGPGALLAAVYDSCCTRALLCLFFLLVGDI